MAFLYWNQCISSGSMHGKILSFGEYLKWMKSKDACPISIYLSIHLFIYLSIYPSIYLSIYPSIYLSIYLSRFGVQSRLLSLECNLENKPVGPMKLWFGLIWYLPRAHPVLTGAYLSSKSSRKRLQLLESRMLGFPSLYHLTDPYVCHTW